jgi:hypothetical protein
MRHGLDFRIPNSEFHIPNFSASSVVVCILRPMRARSIIIVAAVVIADLKDCTTHVIVASSTAVAQASGAAPTATYLVEKAFASDTPAEAIATIRATCSRCDWGVAGREGAAIEIAVDGRYRSHLMLTRGHDEADYRLLLGHVEPGSHKVELAIDSSKSAHDIGTVRVTGVDIAVVGEQDASYEGVAHAPILHARPNTIGRFSDVPLLMWYETATTARGRRHRYSVIFSNEDGGTATDRLMATWGRTTDIEFVYGVEVDANGRTLAEEFQGPDHVVTPFRGTHDARHPLEFVVTDNNMVSDTGTGAVRYAPAPELFDLTDRSREVVMDAHAWSYRVTSQEMLREGKVADDARAGSGKIPDPRRFVFVEACSDLENAALSFGVRSGGAGSKRLRPDRAGAGSPTRHPRWGAGGGAPAPVEERPQPHRAPDMRIRRAVSASVRAGAGSPTRHPRWGAGGGAPAPVEESPRWYDSDRGREQFRIVRTGCFRGAVPLPRGAAMPDAIRFRAWPHTAAPGAPSAAAALGTPPGQPANVHITRVNAVFMLADDFVPKPSRFSWTGSLLVKTDGTPSELRIQNSELRIQNSDPQPSFRANTSGD